MPYKIDKKKCKQSDGDAGTHVLSYTDGKGKDHENCHTSKKGAQGQIAAIEGDNLAETDEDAVDEALIREYIREKLLLSESTYRGALSQDAAAAKLKELAISIPDLSGDQVDRVVFSSKGARLHTKDFYQQPPPSQAAAAKQLAVAFVKAINPDAKIDESQIKINTGEDTAISRSYARHLVTFPPPIDDSISIVFASQAAGGARGGGYGYEQELFQALEAQQILHSPDTADAAKVDVFVSYTDETGEQQVAAIEAKKQNAKFGEPTMRYNFKSPKGFTIPPTARSKENSEATAALLNSKTSRDVLSAWMKALKDSYDNAAKIWNGKQENKKNKVKPRMTDWSRVSIDVYNIMKAEKKAGRFPFTTTKDIPADASRITSYYQKKNAHYIQIQGKGLYIFSNGVDPLGIQEMLKQAGGKALPEFTTSGAMAKATASVKISVQTSSGKILRAVGELSMKDIPESSFSFDNPEDIKQLAEWLESRFKKAIEAGEVSPDEEPEISVDVQVDQGISGEEVPARLGSNPVMTEASVRLMIRQRLMEDLSRADRKEIERMFKKSLTAVGTRKILNKEIEKTAGKMIKKELDSTDTRKMIDKSFKKQFDKELKDALGVSFFGNPGKINKFVIDEIHKEVDKILGDAATRELVVQICKDVIIKLYRELSYSYQPVIQRLKV